MEKIIKIGKQEVRLNNNVGWTMEYRDQFGKDVLPTLLPIVASAMESVSAVVLSGGDELTLEKVAEAIEGKTMDVLLPMFSVEFVDTIINVTWAMAKAADEDILPPKQWVKQFDSFPIDIVAPAIYEFALKGFVSSKNLKRLETIRANLKNLQPSRSTKSSSQESKED